MGLIWTLFRRRDYSLLDVEEGGKAKGERKGVIAFDIKALLDFV
jgi:hypothetical protein